MAQQYLSIIMTNNVITNAWIRPSYNSALNILRRWYATLRVIRAIDDNKVNVMSDSTKVGVFPSLATLKEIDKWYANDRPGYNVNIIAIESGDPFIDVTIDLNFDGKYTEHLIRDVYCVHASRRKDK